MKKFALILGALILLHILAACDILVKKPAKPVKKTHFELIMGNTPVMCKKKGLVPNGIGLQDCIAIVGGIPMQIPNIDGAANVMEFPDQEEGQ